MSIREFEVLLEESGWINNNHFSNYTVFQMELDTN